LSFVPRRRSATTYSSGGDPPKKKPPWGGTLPCKVGRPRLARSATDAAQLRNADPGVSPCQGDVLAPNGRRPLPGPRSGLRAVGDLRHADDHVFKPDEHRQTAVRGFFFPCEHRRTRDRASGAAGLHEWGWPYVTTAPSPPPGGFPLSRPVEAAPPTDLFQAAASSSRVASRTVRRVAALFSAAYREALPAGGAD